MKHFWRYKTSDDESLNLLEHPNGQVIIEDSIFGYVCRGCGQRTETINKEITEAWREHIKQFENIIGDFPPLWLSDPKSNKHKLQEFADKYIEEHDLNSCHHEYPRVIKTRDVDFVNFLKTIGYKIKQIVVIGRSDKYSSSESESSESSGLFSHSRTSSSSSESKARRLDIPEFIMIKTKS